MNSRDLINNLLTNRGPFDRVGLFEHFWGELTGLWGAEAVRGLTLDFDMMHCGGWFNNEAIEGASEIVAESDEWVVKRNGSGASLRWWKTHSGTPEHIEFLMKSRAIWESDYRPHVPTGGKLSRLEGGPWKGSGTIEQDRAALALARSLGKWAFYGHVFIWETLRQSLGDLVLFESLVLDPGWIKDFNRVFTDYYKAEFRLLFETLGLPDGVWIYEDLGYKNGLFASPRVLKELVFPYFTEMVDFLHGYGLPVVLHSCGNVTKALPMIVDAGFDALQPMEVKAGCDPFAFAEQYRDRLAFIGGLDIRFLETNDRQVIEREVSRLVDGMKARGARYVFHSDHSVTPLVQHDSYCYALDVYRAHMAY